MNKKPSRPHSFRRPTTRVLKSIRLFATDVDGVLTDGGMYYSESGQEMKKFNVWDGMGIKMLQSAGVITCVVTALETKLVAQRGTDLKIPEVHQGVRDKLIVLQRLAGQHGLSLQEIAYIGDDINDLAALQSVGFSATPANGRPELRQTVHHVCTAKGGEGAVREVVDLILKAKGVKPKTVIRNP